MTAEQALRLLAGTGITYQLTGNNTAMLQRGPPAPRSPHPVEMPPVDCRSDRQPQSDISSLPEPYAGNQMARGGRVGALGNRDMMETPFKVNSYTSELIRNQQADTIAEVLQNDPAVRTPMASAISRSNSSFAAFRCSATISRSTGCTVRATPDHRDGMYERVEVLARRQRLFERHRARQ